MVGNFKSKREEGFTIIEVLIVLAIAGLIMLIVFLAVPALQRNSRNTQARNEAANILGAVSEIVTNKNGKAVVAGDSAGILAAANVQNVTTLTIEAEAGTTVPTATTAVLRLVAKCNASNNETDAGVGRQYSLLYLIETSAGSATTCTSS